MPGTLAPVFVKKDGRIDTLIASIQQFDAFEFAGQELFTKPCRRLKLRQRHRFSKQESLESVAPLATKNVRKLAWQRREKAQWVATELLFLHSRDTIKTTATWSLSSLKNIVIYSVKEIFYTLQGEGAQAGRPAVFCRFSGCNLWSGREADRASAVCQFCDTDFVGTDGEGGGKFPDSEALARTIDSLWPQAYPAHKYVVFTGGEPLLQLDEALIAALHAHGFTIAIETNGTLPVPPGVDWVCVSPKMGSVLQVKRGDEIKVVIPQVGQHLIDYAALDFAYFFVQPMDGPHLAANTQLAIKTCRNNPQWRLSLQTHKLLSIP